MVFCKTGSGSEFRRQHVPIAVTLILRAFTGWCVFWYVVTSGLTPVRRVSQAREKVWMSLGETAPTLVPVSQVMMCMNCASDFSLTLRRHHCAACGKVSDQEPHAVGSVWGGRACSTDRAAGGSRLTCAPL